MLLSICNNPDVLSIFLIIKIIIDGIKIVVPIILIVALSLKFLKVVKSGDDNALKDAEKAAIKSAIACIAVFLIPMCVSTVVKLATSSDISKSCFTSATSDHIESLYIAKAEELLANAEFSEDYNELGQARNEIYKIKDPDKKKAMIARAKAVEVKINEDAEPLYVVGSGVGGYQNYPYAGGYFNGTFNWPANGRISSPFGMRMHPTKHVYKMHNGIDIAVNRVSVYASAPGVVSNVTFSSCGGNMVFVNHSIDGEEYQTVYMHLNKVYVKENTPVDVNTVLGISGGGESYDVCTTGPHLHFEIRYNNTPVDPLKYLPQN